jgi:hypothetical protein
MMNKRQIKMLIMRNMFFILWIVLLVSCSTNNNKNTIDLSGEWAFRTDPESKGITGKWYLAELPESIKLPGSMTENGKGDEISVNTPWTGGIVDSSWFHSPELEKYRQPGNVKVPFWLQPVKYYTGMAWYQKKVKIPASWKGNNIQLFLERCHWETRVWVDDQEAGMQNSLGTPHVYDLSAWLTPGIHLINICVDNRIKEINVGENSHSVSDHTQSNWNGMAGRLELQARSPVFISDIEIYPDIEHKQARTKLIIQNTTKSQANARISIVAVPEGKDTTGGMMMDQILSPGSNEIEINYPMGENPLLWDEFQPDLYRMKVTVTDPESRNDNKEVTFGMREFKTKGTQFTINGRPLFLRGTLECAIFPETGYPPTDTASWMRIYRIARAHGLNHLRFHSWCPPEAAFTAADHAGFYLHVECSSWANSGSSGSTIGDGKPLDQYLYDESNRMIRAYGNHPSFCIMLYGNEPAGMNQTKWLADFVTFWKNKDPRRLYSSGAGWPILPETDFNSTPNPRIQGWGEGLNSIINAQPPSTDYDWTEKLVGFNKPTVSHEIGQWCVYPDFKEIAQYTGVLKARNFEIFQESLRQQGMENLADSFLLASGKLQTLCYKADIEAALRTPGFAGFQLLDLHDFPGQGTALVGVLNPFWRSKGYVTPQEFNRFCNTTVLLIRLPKMVYRSDESLKATAEIAHFGSTELTDIIPVWKLADVKGQVLFSGELAATIVPIGNGKKLGDIIQPLNSISDPEKLTLTLQVSGFENSWDIWVYPAALPETDATIHVTQKLDARALDVLNRGGKVLLTPAKGSVKPECGGDIAVGFSSIFWNTAWTGKQAPHTLGILCNPAHPALSDFPTECHSNWQWWDAMSHSNAIILSGLPTGLQPIVRIIDDWFTNRPLAMIFEANTGKGKIMVCGADLLTDQAKRPEARQLLYSLKHYMAGDGFKPSTFVETEKISALYK